MKWGYLKLIKDYEKKIIAKLLKQASEEFSNHGCNDTDDEILNLMTPDEKNELEYNMAKDQGEEEEFEKDNHFFMGYDYMLMSYFARKLDD